MNRWDFSQITGAFPDIVTSNSGPTRGDAKLDLVASNAENFLAHSEIYPPLETEDGLKRSDRSIVFLSSNLPKKTRVG